MEINVGARGVQEDCKGRFFRYTESRFTGQNERFVYTRELRPLKGISCSGCPECSGLTKDLATRANEKDFVQFGPTLKSGDTVTLLQVPVSRNESGELEQWYYEVQRVT